MIIVDGIDGAGKTTLCKMLKDHGIVEEILPSPRVPAKGNAERMKYETDRYLRVYANNNQVAVDRYLFSEMVYGPVLRGKSAFTRQEYLTKMLELFLDKSIVVFCMPDKLNFKPGENPEVIKNAERLKELYQCYIQDAFFTFRDRTYVYKWDEPNAFKKLRKFIKEKQ